MLLSIDSNCPSLLVSARGVGCGRRVWKVAREKWRFNKSLCCQVPSFIPHLLIVRQVILKHYSLGLNLINDYDQPIWAEQESVCIEKITMSRVTFLCNYLLEN